MPTQILTTKLYRPPSRANLVSRSRLVEQLNEGLQRKLTLISAPAGFGKTTLVTEWIADCQRPVAWLSLDEGDNDPARFLTYFVAALQTLESGENEKTKLGTATAALLNSPRLSSTEEILTNLLNDITAFPRAFILVLDDYHVINTQTIDDSINFLLEHLPPQMHLVLATREDPMLPLARYRALGQMTELRAADLRFDTTETGEFLNRAMELDLSTNEIDALANRTEGWIVGLQLAALSMKGRADTAEFIQAFAGDNRFIVDYLVEEVLRDLSESIREFLLRTSILNQLCGPLCDAVTGQEHSRRTLETLERGNLFVVPLDDRRHWYRYHHLFADVLHARLLEQTPDLVPELHRRASKWHEQQNLPSLAIHHSLAQNDFARAADLAELAWPAWSGSYQSITWLGWLKLLPDEEIRARPVLCVNCAWALLNAGDLEAAAARLRDAERWLAPATNMDRLSEDRPPAMIVIDEEQFCSLPVSLATARAYHAQAVGDLPATVTHARRVLELVPEGEDRRRGDATALLGLAYWASGDLEAAHRSFADGLAGMKPLDVILGAFVLADIQNTLGFLREAIQTCDRALALATAQGEPLPIGTEDVYSALGELFRQQGDLNAAMLALATCKSLGERIELPDWQYRWCIAQARLLVSRGDLAGALDLLDEAERVYVRTPLPVVRPIVAEKTRVLIRQGHLADAFNWARTLDLTADDELCYLHEFEHITLARLLLADYRVGRQDGSLHQAERLIERLLQTAEAGKRLGSVIELLVLHALALAEQGDVMSALVPLQRALALAEAEGYVQVFVDEGPPMAKLLYEALSGDVAPQFTRRLLSTFPADETKQQKPADPQTADLTLIEPLTQREIEVLQLIADGLTNQEIATRLFLSPNTVKVHTRNINGKLAVNSRTKAVARARVLGVLSST